MVKNLPASAGDLKDEGWIPGLGRSPGRGQGGPLQYSCLENPMDRGAWWATAHMAAKSQTQLKRLKTHTHTHPHTYTHTHTHTSGVHLDGQANPCSGPTCAQMQKNSSRLGKEGEDVPARPRYPPGSQRHL